MQAQRPSTPHWPWLLILLLTFLAQLLLTSISFPLSELFSAKPLLYIDNALHWYQLKLAATIAPDLTPVAYDPFFAAGYLGGATYNISARLPALIVTLIGPLADVTLVWKLYVFLLSLLAPLCIPLAGRILKVNTVALAAMALLGLLLWWTSYFRWFFTAGMVSYVASCYFSVLYAAWFWQFLAGNYHKYTVVPLGIMGGVLLFFHPFFPVPVAILIFWLSVLQWRAWRTTRMGAALVLIPLFSLAMNFIWYAPMMSSGMFWGDLHTGEPYQQGGIHLLVNELLGIFEKTTFGARVYLPIAVLAVIGVLGQDASRSRRVWAAWFLAGLSVEVLRSVGEHIVWIAKMEPHRFSPLGYLLLTIPAGRGLAIFLNFMRRMLQEKRWGLAALGYAPLVAGVVFFGREALREAAPGDHPHTGPAPPYVMGVGHKTQWIVEWIKSNTHPSARILFETSQGRFHDGDHSAGYIAATTQRELIGGVYPGHHFAGFSDGFAFGDKLQNLDSAQFMRYMETYNVGWIMAFNPRSKQYFERQPHVKLMAEFDGLAAYQVTRNYSFFQSGQGLISSQYNRLVLDELTGPIVSIKYHYLPGLQSLPPTQIKPVFIGDDPIPFIQLLNPPKTVTLFVDSTMPSYDKATREEVSQRARLRWIHRFGQAPR